MGDGPFLRVPGMRCAVPRFNGRPPTHPKTPSCIWARFLIARKDGVCTPESCKQAENYGAFEPRACVRRGDGYHGAHHPLHRIRRPLHRLARSGAAARDISVKVKPARRSREGNGRGAGWGRHSSGSFGLPCGARRACTTPRARVKRRLIVTRNAADRLAAEIGAPGLAPGSSIRAASGRRSIRNRCIKARLWRSSRSIRGSVSEITPR